MERGRGHGERKIGQLAMLVGVLASFGRFVGLVLEPVGVAGARAWCVAELGRERHREAAQAWREGQ